MSFLLTTTLAFAAIATYVYAASAPVLSYTNYIRASRIAMADNEKRRDCIQHIYAECEELWHILVCHWRVIWLTAIVCGEWAAVAPYEMLSIIFPSKQANCLAGFANEQHNRWWFFHQSGADCGKNVCNCLIIRSQLEKCCSVEVCGRHENLRLKCWFSGS